jgi:hypothetical protein
VNLVKSKSPLHNNSKADLAQRVEKTSGTRNKRPWIFNGTRTPTHHREAGKRPQNTNAAARPCCQIVRDIWPNLATRLSEQNKVTFRDQLTACRPAAFKTKKDDKITTKFM